MKQGRRAEKFMLLHWWTSVNCRQSTENTKVELYSEVTWWKMILDLMQYLQNKDHQHHKWLQQKSWISYPDCQGAQDKQLMQYPPIRRSKWKMHPTLFKIPKVRMSRYLDTSTKTQVAKIMVQYGRPSRSSWTESVRSSFGRTVMGKAIWENPIETWLGEGFQLGMSSSYTVKKDYSYLCMWMTSNWLERNKMLIRCGKYSTKKLIWENQRFSSIMCTWDVLKDNVK